MTLLLRAAGVTMLGIAVAGCGSGGTRDEDAIQALLTDVMTASVDGDADQLAGLFSADCGDMQRRSEEAAEDARELQARIGDSVFEFVVSGVDIRNLEQDSAEADLQGTITIRGETTPLGSGGAEYTSLTKENGEWKIAACDLLGS